MPVAALRALVFAALVDDPGDDSAERARRIKLIEDLVASSVESPPKAIVDAARELIAQCVDVDALRVFDPFVGGGSTLVEAQRLGLSAVGSDLNPIPVLITKALTSIPPAVFNQRCLTDANSTLLPNAPGLAGFLKDVRHYATRIRDEAWMVLKEAYPTGPNGDVVSAWWWARTVESPDPRFRGCQVPLVSNWWLSKKTADRAFVVPDVDRLGRTISYRIERIGEPAAPSKNSCLYSGVPIPFKYIRERGDKGQLGLDLIATITNGSGSRWHPPDTFQITTATSCSAPADAITLAMPESALGFRVQNYGIHQWSELFTSRQQLSLCTFADFVAKVPSWVDADGGTPSYGAAVATVLGLCVGKLAQTSSALCRWMIDGRNGAGGVLAAFASQYLSMSWDFIETNPFGGSVGDWLQVVETALGAFKCVDPTGPATSVTCADARVAAKEFNGNALIVTDPPYFAAVGYANLSDYFYPWIRRSLKDTYPKLLATVASPKQGELIAEPARHDSPAAARDYFVSGFTEAFSQMLLASDPTLPMLIVYAYKEQEAASQDGSGWEAMLAAVIDAGLGIVGTWPIHGTGSARIRGYRSNALATYVVMVCRPRGEVALRGSRRDFLVELRKELGPAIDVLQTTSVAPVDLAQAVIGPGMAVFTRYDSVLEPDGSAMTVRSALLLINSVLAEILDEQNSDYDADTRWAIAWFEQYQFGEAMSGDADALARAKVTSIDALERAGVIRTRAGTTRLVRRDELDPGYDPLEDRHQTVWESVQHLVKRLSESSENAAAALLARLANRDAARDLAYRLYSICERKGWSDEAAAYNVLVASWPEIARLAQRGSQSTGRLPGFSEE